jgi:hypothetical protein
VTVTGPVGAEALDEAVVEEMVLDEAIVEEMVLDEAIVEETVLEEIVLEVALSELELVELYIFKRFAPPQYSLALPRQVSSHPLTLGIVLVWLTDPALITLPQ